MKNQVESYCWCYRDLFELKTKESQEIVNSQLIEFLDEWRQDAPSRYRKAKDDICYWITGVVWLRVAHAEGDRNSIVMSLFRKGDLELTNQFFLAFIYLK